MKLIIGLGNPGRQYEHTWHNLGFLYLDYLISKIDADSFSINKKLKSEITKKTVNSQNIILAKPIEFMNNSGQSTKLVAAYYKIDPTDIIVIHDDLDITFGEYKIQHNRGHAGHNGIKSIFDHLKSKDFSRIRIGIKSKLSEQIPSENFVLSNIPNEQLTYLKENVFTKISAELKNRVK